MFYSEEYQPSLGDCGKNGQMTYPAMLQLIENVGGHHSDKVGDNLVVGSQHGLVAVAAEWRLEFTRRPDSTEKIKVTTWVTGQVRSAVIIRHCTFTDSEGNIILKAEAKLCLIDLETKMLARMTEELCRKYDVEEEKAFETDLKKLKAPQEYETEMMIQTRRCDIDFNNHVHNVRYVDMALDALPRDVYDEYNFTQLRIVYIKPIEENEKITAKYEKTESGHFIGIFADGTLCTMVEFR